MVCVLAFALVYSMCCSSVILPVDVSDNSLRIPLDFMMFAVWVNYPVNFWKMNSGSFFQMLKQPCQTCLFP